MCLYMVGVFKANSLWGRVFTPYTLHSTFHIFDTQRPTDHVDFYGGRKTGEPEKKPTSNKLNSFGLTLALAAHYTHATQHV